MTIAQNYCIEKDKIILNPGKLNNGSNPMICIHIRITFFDSKLS